MPDDDAERDYRPAYLSLASGRREALGAAGAGTLRWPVAVRSIGNTIGSYQRYETGLQAAYFHQGLDIRADAGSPVEACRGGKVVNVGNYNGGDPSYWEVAILDSDGFLWQYHHIERGSIPKEIFDAYRTGGSVLDGARLGAVHLWPIVTFGERYNHVHLNVIGGDRAYLDPFSFLAPLPDASAPEILDVALFQDGQRVSGNAVRGAYGLLAEVRDLILSDRFYVPPQSIRLQIDGQAPVTVWDFESLPGGGNGRVFVNQLYIPSMTCGDYSCRKFVIDLGFTVTGPRAFPTAPGEHSAAVEIRDFQGNAASRDFHWTVR